MEVTFVDGTGKGFSARVDANFRIRSLADSQSLSQAAAQLGDTFNFNTGSIELTTANESAVAFLENQTENKFVIPAIGYLLGNSTAGVGDLNLKVVKNPKAGTIITNAVAVDVFENKNAGKIKTFSITDMPRFKGVEGDTFTDGAEWFPTLLPGSARQHIITTGDLVLEPGTSIGMTIKPQASNTSMFIQIFMAINNLSNVLL